MPTTAIPAGPDRPYDLPTTSDAIAHLSTRIEPYENIFPVIPSAGSAPVFSKDVIPTISRNIKQGKLKLPQDWGQQLDQALDMTQFTNEPALEIILRSIFGDDFETRVLEDTYNPSSIVCRPSARLNSNPRSISGRSIRLS